MTKRGPRPLVFICACLTPNKEMIVKSIIAQTQAEASDLFKSQFLYSPQEILGPFLKKRTQVIETTRELKFSNQIKKAIYNDWVVNAFILQEPENQAYLVFLNRTDDKKVPIPKGTITVPISDLRFI